MRNRFKSWRPPKFYKNGMTKWNWKCQYYENLKLGKYTDVGSFCYINAKHGVELQDYVEIGSHCSLYTVSTIDSKEGKITIKENAKIGTHSVIMPGVTVGRNSIIGAFSFINKDIPDNALAYGIPVKIIKKLKEKPIRRLSE